MGAFLKFVFDSMFGYLYTLILGGGNYGRVFGVFSIRCLDIFTHWLWEGGGNYVRIL